METVRVDASDPRGEGIERAAEVIRAGGLVAFPTETVYGLGANALDADAVARIFEAKGRPRHNPLIVHVAGASAARRLVTNWPDVAESLAAAYWPGPLTLVLPRRPDLPAAVSAGLPTVAVRVPSHPVALALLEASDRPIVAPSANPSMALSPTRAEHVSSHLGDRIDVLLDAGPTGVGIESTVVDLSGERPTLLRPGAISARALEALTGPLDRPSSPSPGTTPRSSPGMLDRHYAPRATLHLFTPGERGRAAERAAEARAEGDVVGAVVFDSLEGSAEPEIIMPRDPEAYARELYAVLHRLDALGCDRILVERVPDGAAWEGVRDRLERASHR